MQPTAGIITIGDEILIGQVVDTNSAFIGSTAADSGVRVTEILSIRDTKEAIMLSISELMARVDIVIVTGGLGPTKDDITKKAIAELFSVELYRDMETYNHVKDLLTSRGVEFNELNKAQADIPEGFSALHNAVGTAPAMYYNGSRGVIFCLPGVPFEMKKLFTEEVLPRIKSHFSLDEVVRRTVVLYGIPESELAVKLEEWETNLQGDELSLAYLPNPSNIRLRISSNSSSRTTPESLELIDNYIESLKQIVPTNFLGAEGSTVTTELARLLSDNSLTLSTAESCSGGSIAKACTALSGSSAWFSGGIVAYSNEVKASMLGVQEATLDRFGAVSSEVVSEMALGALERIGSDYAIATSGIAGPTGATDSKELGEVYIAIASKKNGVERVYHRNFGQPREVFVERLTAAALNYLRLILLETL